MESEDISDLLNRVEYVSEVYSYDRELLVAYQETVQQVADLESQLEQELADMEELKQSYDQQEASLNQVINEKKAQIADFDSQLSNAKTLASQYASTIRKQNEVIAQEQARQEKARKEAEEKAKKAAKAGTKTSNSATTASTDSGTTDSTGGSSSSNNTASTDDSDNSSSGSSSTGLTNNGLNPSYSTGVSGSSVVSYATNFVGNPYVFGGNSLTEGTDCSGLYPLYTAILAYHFREVPMRFSQADRLSAMRTHSRETLSVIRDMWQSIWEAAGSSMHQRRRAASVMEMRLTVRSQWCAVCCKGH